LLTRKTVAEILVNIEPAKFVLYQANPEEFINKVSKIINEQKATLIVDHVTYDQIEGNFDAEIFAESKAAMEFKLAYKAEKHIKDYVFVDGINKDTSIERDFAVALDNAEEVCVYAKLPRGFYIPTPVGNYSPDWAIAFNEGTVKHIYFVAETKGSLDSLQLRAVERAKIDCARKLFNEISTSKVRYEYVSTYTDLLDKMNALA
jgi:type III restriction enzyme